VISVGHESPRTPEAHTIIEVFADVVCPFTHLGLRRFVERRRQLDRPDVLLRVRAWPLELVNGAALDADFVAEEVDELRRQVDPDAFAGFDVATFPKSTLPALRLTAAAEREGEQVGEQVSLALRDALFEQGLDISRSAVLDEIAVRHGIRVEPEDGAAVRADLDEGVRLGVVGSPHFFTPGGDFFCPALDISRDEHGHLHVDADPQGFDHFMTACFGLDSSP
jgi:predicted DsbA family dithiol-disulfide isomerase